MYWRIDWFLKSKWNTLWCCLAKFCLKRISSYIGMPRDALYEVKKIKEFYK